MKLITKNKIEKLLAKLNCDKKVSRRDLLNTLGEHGLSEYLKLWEAEITRRDGRRNIAVFSKEDIKKKVLSTALAKIEADERAFSASADVQKLKGMLAELMRLGR
jgi:hypothetical protein